jgi:hypothetical protein
MAWLDLNTKANSGSTGNQSGFMDNSGWTVNLASHGGVATSVATPTTPGGLPTWAIVSGIAAAVLLMLRKGKA